MPNSICRNSQWICSNEECPGKLPYTLSFLALWRGVSSPAGQRAHSTSDSDPFIRPPDFSSGYGSQLRCPPAVDHAGSPTAVKVGVGCPAQVLFALGIKLLSFETGAGLTKQREEVFFGKSRGRRRFQQSFWLGFFW